MEREIYKNTTAKMRRFGYFISSVASIAVVLLAVYVATLVC